jgi:O-antigen/teichoic acid export membrane protein
LIKRYFFTFSNSIIRSIISFITGILIARFLGPNEYGRLAFLLATFLSIKQFTDLGSSQAFFLFMSQCNRSKKFIYKYFTWLFLQLVSTFIFILIIIPQNYIDKIWHGESKLIIILSLSASFMQNTLWPSVQQALDSQRKNFLSQGLATIVVLIHFAIVYFLIKLNSLGLYLILFSVLIEYFVAAIVLFFHIDSLEIDNTNDIGFIKLFFDYCKPLFIYSIVGFSYSFIDTWLLQKFGGNINQSFFSISNQISSIALLATISITNIFFKEVAASFHEGNNIVFIYYYKKTTRFLFFFATMVTCFAMPWVNDIIKIILGEKYLLAAPTLLVMFLYPIHQSMGQIQSLLLIGTNNINFYVKTGLIFMLISIIVSYFLFYSVDTILPNYKNISLLLALKMVIMQFIQVNVLGYLISNKLKTKFDWMFQPILFSFFIFFSFLSTFIAIHFNLFSNLYIKIFSSFCIYVFFILFFVYHFPALVGIEKDSLKKYLKFIPIYFK